MTGAGLPKQGGGSFRVIVSTSTTCHIDLVTGVNGMHSGHGRSVVYKLKKAVFPGVP